MLLECVQIPLRNCFSPEDLSWQAGPEVLSRDCVSGVNAQMMGEELDRGLTLLKIISQFS